MRYIVVLILIINVYKTEAQDASVLALGDSLYTVGNYNAAIAQYMTVTKPTPSIYLKIARSHKAKGTLQDAIAYYKLASSQGNPIAMGEYGKLLILKKETELADSVYTILIRQYPDNPDYYYQRGRAKQLIKVKSQDTLYLENIELYLSDFEAAINLDTTHQKALYELGKHHLKKGNYNKVRTYCELALKSYPDNPSIISLLAQYYYKKGLAYKAIEYFEKLKTAGEATQFVYEKLGNCYYRDRMYELAIENYMLALSTSPEDFYLHETLAKLYNYTENTEKAILHGKLALQYKDLPLEENYFTLANTYKLNKQWPEAMQYINLALQENPNLEKAYYAKAVISDNYYKDKKAIIRLYENFITRNPEEYYPNVRNAKSRLKMLKTERFMSGDN